MNKMSNKVLWQYDETFQAGADYADVQRAMAYDEHMQKIRDYKKRAEEIKEMLLLNSNDILIDFGCGTGSITMELAKNCRKVFCIDTSPVMLEIASNKACSEEVFNITFFNYGFLTYNHKGELADKIMTGGAFHHLPDFWKVIALQRIHGMLKEDGLFLLSDVVFSFDPKDYITEINSFHEFLKVKSGEELYNDGLLHLKEEFSTFDWLMDEMLRRTGFDIDSKVVRTKTNIDYVCKKIKR